MNKIKTYMKKAKADFNTLMGLSLLLYLPAPETEYKTLLHGVVI